MGRKGRKGKSKPSGPKVRSEGLLDWAEIAAIALMLDAPSSDGQTTITVLRAQGPGAAAQRAISPLVNIKDVWGGDPYWAPSKAAQGAVIAIPLVKKGIRMVAPSLSRMGFRIGKYRIRPFS